MRLSMIPQSRAVIITCSKGDTTMRRWTFELYSNGSAFTPDFDAVNLVCSNGAVVPGTITANEVSIDATEELTRSSGAFMCNLEFTKGTDVLHSQNFMLIVEAL